MYSLDKKAFQQYLGSIQKKTMSFQRYLFWLVAQQQGVK